MYNFDGDHKIWDQNDYEERVKVEAEMLVALEALKESVMYLGYDINDVQDRINQQMGRVRHNQDHIYENMVAQQTNFGETLHRVEHLQEAAYHGQMTIHDHEHALILYCQQFAFAPEMVGPCASLLSCRERQLPYKFNFAGAHVHDPHAHHDIHTHSGSINDGIVDPNHSHS